MNDAQSKAVIRSVMQYFHCNEEVATKIIECSQQNGEYTKIMNMCTVSNKQRSASNE